MFTNVTLIANKVWSIIYNAVESRNAWIPRVVMKTPINNTLCHCTDTIYFIQGAKVSTKATCNIILVSRSVDYPIYGKFKGTGWKS